MHTYEKFRKERNTQGILENKTYKLSKFRRKEKHCRNQEHQFQKKYSKER